MSRRNLALGVALAGLGLLGALLPLAITRGPVRPPLINADGPLPRQAGLRGQFLNRCACSSAGDSVARVRVALR